MPDRASTGLRYLNQLLIGVDELQWLQDEQQFRDGVERLGAGIEPGWVGGFGGRGNDDFGWELRESGGQLKTRAEFSGPSQPFPSNRLRNNQLPFLGIDPFGRRLEVGPDDILYDEDGLPITVPNDGVWYTLIARFGLDVREPGTLTLSAGSTTITGSRTRLRRYADGTDIRPTRIRIDAADGAPSAAGTYQFATISSDTSATLTTAPPVSGTVRFRVRGNFYSAVPADPDCHVTPTVYWELVTRTVSRPADGLICYDVRRSGGTLALIDRRHAQVFRVIRPEARNVNVTWPMTRNDYDGLDNLAPDEAQVYEMTADEICRHLQLTGTFAGSRVSASNTISSMLLCMMVEDTVTGTDRVIVKDYVPWGDGSNATAPGSTWYNPDGSGSECVVVSGTNMLGCAIASIPRTSGNSHLAFYSDSSGILYYKASTDNGQNWSAATVILNPAGSDRIGPMDAVLTRLGRLIVMFEYRINLGDTQVRYVYSDDYGASWQDNGGAGFTVFAEGAVDYEHPRCREDAGGNLWTVAIRKAGGFYDVRMTRGSEPNVAVPNTNEFGVTGLDISRPSAGFFGLWNLELVPTAQDGELLVFVQFRSNVGPGQLIFTDLVHTSMARVVRIRKLVTSKNQVGAWNNPQGIAAALTNSGHLLFVYSTDNSSPGHMIKSADLDMSYSERPVLRPGGS